MVSSNLKKRIQINHASNKKNKLKEDHHFLHSGEWIYKAKNNFIRFKDKKRHNLQTGDLVMLNFKSRITELFPELENTQQIFEVDKVLNQKQFLIRINNYSSLNLNGECEYNLYKKYEYHYFVELCIFYYKK